MHRQAVGERAAACPKQVPMRLRPQCRTRNHWRITRGSPFALQADTSRRALAWQWIPCSLDDAIGAYIAPIKAFTITTLSTKNLAVAVQLGNREVPEVAVGVMGKIPRDGVAHSTLDQVKSERIIE